MSTFREPTSELPKWVRIHDRDVKHTIKIGEGELVAYLNVAQAEALLEVLLDICPNAKALAHNWLLEEQKREYMAGGK